MCSIAPTVCAILEIRSPKSAKEPPMKIVLETMKGTLRLLVIVIDAFGASTWQAGKAKTHNFNNLAVLHQTRLKSVMPTITPVNFATMLTGTDPEAHKIRDRTQELRCETIFDVLKEVDRTSATAARELSSLGILISPFADRPGLAASNTDKEVTKITVKTIQDNVDLVWVQLLDVDDAGHSFGPYSEESLATVAEADINLGEILQHASSHGYSVMVLADHGQHEVVKEGVIQGTHGTDMIEDLIVPLAWANNSELIEMMRRTK